MAGSGLSDLVGIPFVDGGRDPQHGVDCWGLFMLAAPLFGYQVPDFSVSCFDVPSIFSIYQREIRERWRRRETPQPGDAVAMALSREMPDAIQHIGIYIGEGRFLHTMKKVGSCVSMIDHPYWKNKIKGYYEWIG